MTEIINKGRINPLIDPVIEYVLNNIPPYMGLFVMQTDAEGLLKNWFGPWEKYFKNSPLSGQIIDDYAPFLFGMVPPLVVPMVLSHMQINDKIYVEIHILADEDGSFWVIILDQTRQTGLMHPIVQRFYNSRLKDKKDPTDSSAKNTLAALYLLDFMTFNKSKNAYKMMGNTPDWYSDIGKVHLRNDKAVDLKELFPYLEVFEYEAEETWSGDQDGKVLSGIWEETKSSGEKLYLQAYAIRYDQRNYLLIKPLSQQAALSSEFVQKAREQELTLDRLAVTKKKLNQLLDFKDQFVSIISHDLRSPMGAVIGLTELLLADNTLTTKLDAGQLELLGDIRDEMYRLLDYNDKLYHWSNLELGNFRIVKKPIDASNLISYVKKMHLPKMNDKNIRFETALPASFRMQGDETLLGQALNNLVGNAVKFTPEGGTISLLFKDDKAGKRIEVKDTGMGMDQESCDKLFEGFKRHTSMGTKGERGTGLGLGIVKRIIDAHNFNITVESQPGAGSAFRIQISGS